MSMRLQVIYVTCFCPKSLFIIPIVSKLKTCHIAKCDMHDNMICSLLICSLLHSCFLLEIEEPDVKILSLAIVAADRPDIVLEIPESGHPKGLWFTLKEGSKYNLRFSIKVSNNIVCGLKYTNTVWKKGLKGTLFWHYDFLTKM